MSFVCWTGTWDWIVNQRRRSSYQSHNIHNLLLHTLIAHEIKQVPGVWSAQWQSNIFLDILSKKYGPGHIPRWSRCCHTAPWCEATTVLHFPSSQKTNLRRPNDEGDLWFWSLAVTIHLDAQMNTIAYLLNYVLCIYMVYNVHIMLTVRRNVRSQRTPTTTRVTGHWCSMGIPKLKYALVESPYWIILIQGFVVTSYMICVSRGGELFFSCFLTKYYCKFHPTTFLHLLDCEKPKNLHTRMNTHRHAFWL